MSIIKGISLYELTLWGRDLVYQRESVLERFRITEVFLKKIYENFVGTLETVHNREVSVLERCPYQEVRLYNMNPDWSTNEVV